MAELRRYRDVNHVTVFVNPAHIIAAAINRYSDRFGWKATLTLTDGSHIELHDDDVHRLQIRLQGGD